MGQLSPDVFEDRARVQGGEPALEAEPFESVFAGDFRRFVSLADLLRRIGYDERMHKLESLQRVDTARFR